jgi:hypothetical protein
MSDEFTTIDGIARVLARYPSSEPRAGRASA